MTDQIDIAAIKAGVDLLRLDAGINVQDGYVTDGTARPYVLVRPWVGRPDGTPPDSMDGLNRTLTIRWYLHCVGDTREAATAMSQRARTQLLDKRITLTAYPTASVALMKQESADQPVPDETLGFPVFDAICVYRTTVTI